MCRIGQKRLAIWIDRRPRLQLSSRRRSIAKRLQRASRRSAPTTFYHDLRIGRWLCRQRNFKAAAAFAAQLKRIRAAFRKACNGIGHNRLLVSLSVLQKRDSEPRPPPTIVVSGRAIVAWADVGAGTIKHVIPIYPAHNRPPTAVSAIPIWLTDNLYIQKIGVGHHGTMDQRHCARARSDQSDRQAIKHCSFHVLSLPSIRWPSGWVCNEIRRWRPLSTAELKIASLINTWFNYSISKNAVVLNGRHRCHTVAL
jgi:hypothetical protein